MSARRDRALLAALFTLGCEASSTDPAAEVPALGCAAGEIVLPDGSCCAVDAEPDPARGCCPAGTRLTEGACLAAGVAECPMGFVSDAHGCRPILPARECPPGEFAIMGDRACRALADCGAPPYGNIPVEPNTQHVDASHTGQSDGSSDAPWTSIAEALANAADGAIVAVADGTYAESVQVARPVRLWGRCPSLVAIAGGPAVALSIAGASGTEVRDIAVTGAGDGISVSASENVVLERVWVHDVALRGIELLGSGGPITAVVRESLIEATGEEGVAAFAATLSLQAVAVRSSLRGVALQGSDSGVWATVDMQRTLVSGATELGVFATRADLVMTESVVRNILPDATGDFGAGVWVQASPTGRASAVISGSVVEHTSTAGISVAGCDARIEDTTVRDVAPPPVSLEGNGMRLVIDPATADRSHVEVTSSAVDGSTESGILIQGSDVALTAVRVRHTRASRPQTGHGVNVLDDPDLGTPAALDLRDSVSETNDFTALVSFASRVRVEHSVLAETQSPEPSSLLPRALHVDKFPLGGVPSLEVWHSLIERNQGGGIIALLGTTTLEASVVRSTLANGEGFFGDGVTAVRYALPTSMVIDTTRIETSARAAVTSFGASVTLSNSTLECNPIDIDAEDGIEKDGTLVFTPVFEDRGGNTCGCSGTTVPCAARSTGLAPPSAIDPAGP